MNITKRIDAVTADGLAKGPLCPLLGSCVGARCAWYNEDARGCVMAPDSLHLILRTAVTDAAVEIARTYRKEDLR